MLEKSFIQILNMSYVGSLVILLVLLMRVVMFKVPKKYVYLLWAIPLFRLIMPVTFKSILSLLPQNMAPVPNNIGYLPVPEINTGMAFIDGSINQSLPIATPMNSVNPLQVWLFFGSVIWMTGVVVLVTYGIISYIKVMKCVAGAKLEAAGVYRSKKISVPFAMGLIRPRIYLPDSLLAEDSNPIFLHEQAHVKRYDPIFRVIGYLVASVYWFNPLVWVAYHLSGKDMEMACDEWAISRLGEDKKKHYSKLLLGYSQLGVTKHIAPIAFGDGFVKARIKNILVYKKPSTYIIIGAVVILAIAALGLLTNPIGKKSLMADTTEFGDDELEVVALEEAVHQAILSHQKPNFEGANGYETESHINLAVEKVEANNSWQVYTFVLYNILENRQEGLLVTGGSHVPSKLTFSKNKGGQFELLEYWEPRDGSYYASDIRKMFPDTIENQALDSQAFILAQMQQCYRQGVEGLDVDVNQVIDGLLDSMISSSPIATANPDDFIEAYPIEYRELSYYGDYLQGYADQNGQLDGLKEGILDRLISEMAK